MKKMKRVLAVVLALCFAMALVGCGGGGLKTGKYTISMLKVRGIDAVAAAKQNGQKVDDTLGYLEIKDSKNATMSLKGTSYSMTYDSKKFYMNGVGQAYKASGDTITFTFELGGVTMELGFTK